MIYKGYEPIMEIDLEEQLIYGRVANIRDVITFQACTIVDVVNEFKRSVDDYLDFCHQRNLEPNKPVVAIKTCPFCNSEAKKVFGLLCCPKGHTADLDEFLWNIRYQNE